MNKLYEQMDFVLSGGALKLLTDFLALKVPSALVLEPRGADLHILDAIGVNPTSLILKEEGARLATLFSPHPPASPCEMEQVQAEGGEWPWALRLRGAHWEVYILLREKAEDFLMSELKPYAELVRLWQQFQRIGINEGKLSRLSYMILATKNTLASIFEPMPLDYYASFVVDVLRESLFPRSISILKDEGSHLSLLVGGMTPLPLREGIYSQSILPSAPVLIRASAPYQVVLPITEAELRLFCVMEWDNLPDSEMLNFLELLGNLATRALAINSLRLKNTQAASQVSSGEFTILSLSSVLDTLRAEKDRGRFLSLAADIFLELGQMSECLLSLWDEELKGYVVVEHRSGGAQSHVDHPLLPAPRPSALSQASQSFFDLRKTPVSEIFSVLGLASSPWKELESMQYLVPICDGSQMEGFAALSSKGYVPLSELQRAALRIVAQFTGYEFRKFKSQK